jgi:23S rRNA (adenine2503-C2)-methyltransferase
MDLLKVSEYLNKIQEPPFRLKQITKSYYSSRYSSFLEMTDLSLTLRNCLESEFPLYSVKLDKLLEDEHTKKALLNLSDGLKIESVLMDYGNWTTACISSQVGCPLGCTFCATGKMGFKRNLTAEEVIDQILFWKNKITVNRVVFMGMGEPFLNWDNLLTAIKIINSKNGLNIGARKISISTAGITPAIIDFANLNTEINLAISLHSADQKTRESIMPIAKQYSLTELRKSLEYYTRTTNRQVFFEYLLAKDINDTPHHLALLIDFIQSNKLFYLNLIPLNPIKDGLIPSDKLKYFSDELTKNQVNFSIRHSIGQSINSACGQLITDN